MAGRTSVSNEVVGYWRSAAVPGVEVIDAHSSPREWRVICADYAVVMFRSWRGGVRVRGGVHTGEPGLVFCNVPGELMVASPCDGPGSFSVLELAPAVLEQTLAEQQPSSVRVDWSAIMQPISARLRAHFSGFVQSFEMAASAMQAQSQLLELSELLISELIQGARQPLPLAGPPLRAAARMRECLNEEGLNVDLETLAKRVGLSRFQALRAFKQRYGLPPHAYQLCLRMSHARALLRAGAPSADVAARCGFADQSHFTRHFKRFNGVTPAQYARAESASKHSNESGTFRIGRDPDAIVARSDR